MKPMTGLRLGLLMVLIGPCLPGCYYAQAVRGHLEVMGKREPITDVVNAEGTSERLAARLRLVAAARRFSIDELGLPDNDSYRSYADLDRDFVVWNVIAAPEFSLEPKNWCYPVVGCVSYRGYFAETRARRKAQRLAENGYDVALGGVAAYSTLGRFDDPILNTMMHWEDADLVAVMFHELAHQVVYVKDDSGFNESFATAVEEIGLERWLSSRGEEQALKAYRARRDLERLSMAAVGEARADLESLYGRDIAQPAMREQKRLRLEALAGEIDAFYSDSGRQPPAWVASNLNNARLVSLTLYHGRLPAFRRLLAHCNDELACFYARARELAKVDRQTRDARLDAL